MRVNYEWIVDLLEEDTGELLDSIKIVTHIKDQYFAYEDGMREMLIRYGDLRDASDKGSYIEVRFNREL